MKMKEFDSINIGLYRVYWKSGEYSLASIGMDTKGQRWLACANWVSPITWRGDIMKAVRQISSISLIEVKE